MGVLPLCMEEGVSWQTLGLTGKEKVSIDGLTNLAPQIWLTAKITFEDGSVKDVPVFCRIDTLDEMAYFGNGGILHYVLRGLASAA
jgi:aconitate hydratase